MLLLKLFLTNNIPSKILILAVYFNQYLIPNSKEFSEFAQDY